MFSDSENDDDQYAFESDEETRRRVLALQRAQAEQAAHAATRPSEQPPHFGGALQACMRADVHGGCASICSMQQKPLRSVDQWIDPTAACLQVFLVISKCMSCTAPRCPCNPVRLTSYISISPRHPFDDSAGCCTVLTRTSLCH